MSRRTSGRTARRFDAVRRQLAAEPSLPFSRLLDADLVTAALRASGVAFRDRLYPPWVTL